MARGDTRQKIITAARDLMLARSYNATSVDEICAAAGVSKGSFYHFFPTKEELGLAVLEFFYADGTARIRAGAFVRIKDPVGRLLGLFDHLENVAPEFWRHGCLIGNFATELAESSPVIHARVAAVLAELARQLAPVFAPAAQDAEEAAVLAEQLLMVLEGSIILARAHDDPKRIASGLRQFRRSIEQHIRAAGAPRSG